MGHGRMPLGWWIAFLLAAVVWVLVGYGLYRLVSATG